MYRHYTITLPYSWRDRHAYIVGRSGSGKTNLARTIILQDLANDCGVGVLALEAEMLTEEILPYIPDDRMDDMVYVNPSDTECPIPFNPLQLDEGEDIDLRVDDNVTIFQRLMGDTGARMDEILRQTFYALLEHPGSTLLDVERLLVRHDDTFRREIINTTKDEQTRYFFEKTYPSYPKDAHLPITTRIGRLVRPRLVRTLLCQPDSFNFREAMDEGKILLFNLSDGVLGEQTAQVLGQLIVAKIQTAVFSRADTERKARRPFYLYLDEFQAFVGVNAESYQRLLSRSRKYGFGLVLANQNTSQIPNDLLQEILGNVSTLISFNVSHNDAAQLRKEFVVIMGQQAEAIPESELLKLKIGEAWCKIDKTCFPIKTKLADQNPDRSRAKEVDEPLIPQPPVVVAASDLDPSRIF
jgi:Type IV secretion-system coupling protein DNA-binding domain